MNINSISPLKLNFFLNKTEKDKSPVVKNCCAQNPLTYHNSYPKNYYINNLAFKGKDFSEQLIEKLTSSSQDELFVFLDSELKKRIRMKGYHFQTMEDAVQNAMMKIFMIISEYDLPADADKAASEINEIYEEIKPEKDSYISEYGVKSLYAHNDADIELIDSITEDQDIVYLSPASEEELQKQREIIEKLMNNADLTDSQKELIRSRYVGDFLTYQQVADENNSSKLKARLAIKGAILEIQAKKDIVPAGIKQKITDLAKVLDISYEEAQTLSVRYIDILNIPSEIVEERINTILEAFKDEKLTKERYVEAIIASPTLISQNPATVESNVVNLVEKFSDVGLTVNDYLDACLRAPTLFGQSPDTVKSNVTDLVEKYENKGLTVQNYIEACLKTPALFYRSPDTIAEHIDTLRYCFFNTGKNIADKEFFENISKYSVTLTFSTELILLQNLIVQKMFENSKNRRYAQIREFFVNELENGVEDDEIQTPEDIKTYLMAKLDNYLQNKADDETNFISKDIKKESKLRQRFEDYLRNNKNKTYAIKVKNIDCDTDCTEILRNYLNDLSMQITGDKKMFNVICEDDDTSATYNEASRKHGLHSIRLRQTMQSAKLKIRIKKGELTDEEQKKINDLVLLLEISLERTLQLVVHYPAIMNLSVEAIERTIDDVVEKFSDAGLTKKSYIRACVKDPTLFQRYPDTIEKNVRDLVKRFKKEHLTLESYLQVCINNPSLFHQSPDTIEKNVRELVDRFSDVGLTTEAYINKACVKKPQLFHQSPDTIEKNVRELVDRFSDVALTTEAYIRACVKNPQLFYQSPDTIEKNVRELVDRFSDVGLTTEAYINKACVKKPQLFDQSPDTIEKNVRELVDRFSDVGLTTEAYINKACVKNPQLFYQFPDTIEKNVRELVDRFSDVGLTMKAYIRACVKQPSLFHQSPDTIEKNVRELVDRFSDVGLTTEAYIRACVSIPSLFCHSPDTIAQHIDILRFTKYNSGEEIDNKEFFEKILKNYIDLTFSSKFLLIRYLIIPKMFENSKVPKELKGKSGFEKKLIDYLRNNPDEKYTINVKNIDSETNLPDLLSSVLKEISQNALGRDDVFTVNFIKE